MDKFEQDFKNLKDGMVDKLFGTGRPEPVKQTDKVVVNGVELSRAKRAQICNCGPTAKAHLRSESCPQS